MSFQKLTTEQLIKLLDGFKFTRRIDEVQLHHCWIPTHKSFEIAKNKQSEPHLYIQTAMRNSHLKQGWSDIGQHLTLFPDGIWVTGRDFNKIPASIQGRNSHGFAIEMVGNFDKDGSITSNKLGYDVLTGLQKEAIIKLLKYTINFKHWDLKLHNEYSTKTCPGNTINKSTLLQEVKEWGEMENLLKVNLGNDLKFEDYHMVNNKYYVSLREVLELLGYNDIQANVPERTIIANKK